MPWRIVATAAILVVTSVAQAADTTADEVSKRVIEARAVEAVIWGMPAVNYDLMLQEFKRTGGSKRLADRLLTETESRGDQDGWISITQTELAKLLAVSVPTLQRVMRRFVNAGLVNHEYARIRVVDRNGLIAVCRG